ncbi:formylglycine-generating enzyme family protein [Candidatus Amarolinea dominans]|uniref:formylglycine-generating enzyme family protein n=1 Tax=Candidatus Amarolinea dominans TaxID=3140696 RepID=UPI001D5904E1|nr:formylglycine-generating enzyme family protein [Anaerolineae bacterium]
MTADLFVPYLIALHTLLERLGRDHALTADALLYQQRLQENIERTRRHGDNENRRSERSEIIEPLNRLCLDALGEDFNALVRQAQVRLGQDDARERPRKPFEPQTVFIPAGPFLMGSADPAAPPAEQPQHTVHLPDFCIGKYPVTVREYAAFIKDRKAHPQPAGWFNRQPPADRLDHPVTDVSWFDALAYCAWLSEQCKPRVYTLPSEAEWEKAAALSHTPGPSAGEGPGVGGSANRVEDLLGGVQQWTRSLWGSQPTQPDYDYPYNSGDDREITDPQHLPAQARLVHRGGSFKSRPEDLRATARGNALPDSKIAWRGFRVVMQIP